MLDAAEYTPRLKSIYADTIRASMKEEFSYKNDMMIPLLDKIVLNMGVGEAVADSKKIKSAHDEMMLIAGQKPVITKAKNSIAGFKVREEMPLGVKVTLRGARMYEFLERLIYIAMPRIRDFRGVKTTAFDGRGNYAMGVTEQIIFPEIDYDKIDTLRGLDIAITTTAASDDEGRALLAAMRFPFRGSVPAAESVKAATPAEEVVEETPAAEDAPATNEEKDS